MTSKLLSLLILLANAAIAADLTVYTYDSFASKEGLAPVVEKAFKEATGKTVRFVAFGSAGEALNQISLEKKTNADLVLGVDNSLLQRAKSTGAFLCDASLQASLEQSLRFDKEGCFTAFDYGYLAFVYDSRRLQTPAKSLVELVEMPALKKKIVLPDARTSGPGLGLLLWSREQLKEGANDFWKKMKAQQLLTMSSGWSGAYGVFLKGEADVVLSYTTSPAYHIEHEKTDAIRAMLFEEGHYRHIEGVGILKGSAKTELAKRFVQVLLSKAVQEKLPLTQWMYPVDSTVALPESFKKLPPKPKALEISAEEIEKNRKTWIREWTKILSGR